MKRYSLFLILGGGGFAIFCFFVPWLKLDMTSIGSFTETFSGFSIAMEGNSATIVLIAAVAIIGISIYMLIQQTPWKSRIPVLLSSSTGILGTLVVLRLALLHVPEHILQFTTVALGTHWAQVEGATGEMKTQLTDLINLQFGGFGAAIGFIVALIGAWSLPKGVLETSKIKDNSEYSDEQKDKPTH